MVCYLLKMQWKSKIIYLDKGKEKTQNKICIRNIQNILNKILGEEALHLFYLTGRHCSSVKKSNHQTTPYIKYSSFLFKPTTKTIIFAFSKKVDFLRLTLCLTFFAWWIVFYCIYWNLIIKTHYTYLYIIFHYDAIHQLVNKTYTFKRMS